MEMMQIDQGVKKLEIEKGKYKTLTKPYKT